MYTFCDTCFQAVEVIGDMQQALALFGPSGKWPNGEFPCIGEGCPGPAKRVSKAQVKAVVLNESISSIIRRKTLEPHEYYRALLGFGMPDQVEVTTESLEAFLKGYKVVEVIGLETDNRRFYLHQLVLENGVRIHFAASALGALVYKMTRDHNA